MDIKLETVTRLQRKPRAMYTFVCAQEFRREEFAWHSKNVHDEIMGGLNNWLEHRCPLAASGCGFAQRRLQPHNKDLDVIFSPAVESFGVKYTGPMPVRKKGQKKDLLDLPPEVLVKIFGLLDSFSLCNLSITSWGARELCSLLLDQKGCVTPKWERYRKDGAYYWRISHMVRFNSRK